MVTRNQTPPIWLGISTSNAGASPNLNEPSIVETISSSTYIMFILAMPNTRLYELAAKLDSWLLRVKTSAAKTLQ